jgi:hypothetical protein
VIGDVATVIREGAFCERSRIAQARSLGSPGGKLNETETVPDNEEEEAKESVYVVGLSSDIGEPTTVKQALKRPDADKWRESIISCLASHRNQKGLY